MTGRGRSGPGDWPFVMLVALAVAGGILFLPGERKGIGRRAVPPRRGAPLAEAALDCPTLVPPLPPDPRPTAAPDSIRAAAGRCFERARRAYAERDRAPGARYRALLEWRKGIELLGPYGVRTPAFYRAIGDMTDAECELCDLYRLHRKSAEVEFARAAYERASRHAGLVMAEVPDPTDPRHHWARALRLRCRVRLEADEKEKRGRTAWPGRRGAE